MFSVFLGIYLGLQLLGHKELYIVTNCQTVFQSVSTIL